MSNTDLLFKTQDNVLSFVYKEKDYTIQLAQSSDLKLWMQMIECVKDNFPGLETLEQLKEYEQAVIKNINRKTAICTKLNNKIIGVLLFSYKQNCLSCMAVHPAYRKRGIATEMMEKMLLLLPTEVNIWVSTFREDDKKGIAPRYLYKKMGFTEGELFFDKNNYPHQKFILHRNCETNQHSGENEDELWDLYDRDRNLTSKTHRRGDPLAKDEFHLVVHICIFNSRGELLMQKRQPWKKGWPNMWDLSAGGSAVVGDDSRKAAEREVKEELGIDIDLSNERSRFTFNFKNGFNDYWIIEKEIKLEDLKLQEEEVADAKWVTREQLNEMMKKKEVVPYYFLNILFDLKNAEGAI